MAGERTGPPFMGGSGGPGSLIGLIDPEWAMLAAMARPKAFDRETALQAAVQVFWARGFEGASTEALLAAMQISRQSLYDTFGDKRRLFLEALQYYNARSIAELTRGLKAGGSPLAALEKALLAFVSKPAEELAMGCMGVNAICEFGRGDHEVARLGEASGAVLAAALERTIRAGKAGGEIRADLDERQAVRYLATVLAGMKVQARAGAGKAALREIAQVAVRGLARV
jgi:AcrR family transcriptional regulator